jgi:SAM-dependent methyltransferase
MTNYSEFFFRRQQVGSAASASVVVPLFLSLFKVSSVVDVGCGTGTWVKTFVEHGVSDCLGVDGDYVPRGLLAIPQERFSPKDLTQPMDLGRRFDAVCCLEVAEHLPPDIAESFVTELVTLAPLILFSAAVPGQGGTDHINEQWQSYWADKFASHGYVTVDCIRPHIFNNASVEVWYRQNTLVFCTPERCPASSRIITGRPYELDRVHPAMFTQSRRFLVDWYEQKLAEERVWHSQRQHRFGEGTGS